ALRRFRFTWVRTSRSTALRAVAAAVTSLMPVIFTRDAIVCAPPSKGRKNAPSHTGQGRTQRSGQGVTGTRTGLVQPRVTLPTATAPAVPPIPDGEIVTSAVNDVPPERGAKVMSTTSPSFSKR